MRGRWGQCSEQGLLWAEKSGLMAQTRLIAPKRKRKGEAVIADGAPQRWRLKEAAN